MEGYFKVLESVDLGSDINPIVYMYHSIWDKMHETRNYNMSAWNPNTETERCMLRGFKANYQDNEMSIKFCLDLNAVEITDVYGVASDFEEFVTKQLKPYFDYAYEIYLEQRQAKNKKTV